MKVYDDVAVAVVVLVDPVEYRAAAAQSYWPGRGCPLRQKAFVDRCFAVEAAGVGSVTAENRQAAFVESILRSKRGHGERFGRTVIGCGSNDHGRLHRPSCVLSYPWRLGVILSTLSTLNSFLTDVVHGGGVRQKR